MAATGRTLGGKGASLARLVAAGLPVPDGFVVTVGRLPGVRGGRVDAGRRGGSGRRRVPRPSAGRVAVRSSATAEDGSEASYAGQHDSFLDVRGPAEVRAAVERCWASLHTERAVAYRVRRGEDDAGLAVVVQRMVDADAAGVLFTADPVTGDAAAITLNAAWGLGEALVSGQVTPDTFTVDRGTGRLSGRPVVLELRQGHPTLDDAQAERLAALGGRIEALDARPVDVEWCRDGDDLWVVQARPITSSPPGNATRGTTAGPATSCGPTPTSARRSPT